MFAKKILILLAHPDDETLMSGTIAYLAENKRFVQIVYTTSGDGGTDRTTANLSGDRLASARELEVRNAIKLLGIKNPPIFLRFRDGSLKNHITGLQTSYSKLFDEFRPETVISFGPDGVTGHSDHIATGAATDFVFDKKDFVNNLFHIAVSETSAKIYNSFAKNYLAEHSVNDRAVNLKINIQQFINQKGLAASAHKTQFTENDLNAISSYFSESPYEEFILARKRDNPAENTL